MTHSEALDHPLLSRARTYIRDTDGVTLGHQVELTEIPAPPFNEARRGARMMELLSETGASGAGQDEEGNVVAHIPGREEAPALIVSAHLDTVFPEGTDVNVRKENGRLCGPGISDDGRGLAALLAVSRTLREAGIRTRSPLMLVATVGEEGAGDLRGVKHLFREEGPGRRAAGFISLDGAGTSRIVSRALGSKRFRVTVRGEGGHSWVDWGTANPIHALGAAVADLERLPLSPNPPTTLTVARWGGGTSVNAIPTDAWLELDLRSESDSHLRDLETKVRAVLADALSRVASRAAMGRRVLKLDVTSIGARPAGSTDPQDPLVLAAEEATRAVGVEPRLVASSTDANIPMALGIPAITIGGGGEAGAAHTTTEWYENVRGPEGIYRALLTVVLAAGLAAD